MFGLIAEFFTASFFLLFRGRVFASMNALKVGTWRDNIDGIHYYQDGPEIDHGNGMIAIFLVRHGGGTRMSTILTYLL